MKPLALIAFLATFLLLATPGRGQERVLYKELDSIQLYIEFYSPEKKDTGHLFPGMVFFFGGGWKREKHYQFQEHAKYFSKRGIACFLADYRVADKHNTTPYEALKDAKSAIRFVRKHANEFDVDPSKIIASGGSAGGHLAAATALIPFYNDASDDLNISCIPNALVLFNPVIDNGPGGYGYDRIGDNYLLFSPLHNIRTGAPPTIFHLGTKDKLIPVETAEYYKMAMEKAGSRCELKLYEGKGHGFFNYHHFDAYKETVRETDIFLQSLGYLDKLPVVKIE
ncbi:MAG: alpha/beta hydrolase [Lewinellaceae bacterium]|nr:alpha/beta hydrolase [Lewinellaceae bacterium]